MKICNFIWKVIRDSLPTFQTLKGRGIPIATLWPFCDSVEESASHLFLHCNFARACWYGSPLALHTSSLGPMTVQQWLINSIFRHKRMDEKSMETLQLMFITLWSIWNHRNRVIHEGVPPDPMNVILITQNLFCRYQEIFQHHHNTENRDSRQKNHGSRFWWVVEHCPQDFWCQAKKKEEKCFCLRGKDQAGCSGVL